jgi:hypothetical protein
VTPLPRESLISNLIIAAVYSVTASTSRWTKMGRSDYMKCKNSFML